MSAKYISQFAVSGETESFGSNNLMGQWVKAIGGYTVEQIGAWSSSAFTYPVNILALILQITTRPEWLLLLSRQRSSAQHGQTTLRSAGLSSCTCQQHA